MAIYINICSHVAGVLCYFSADSVGALVLFIGRRERNDSRLSESDANGDVSDRWQRGGVRGLRQRQPHTAGRASLDWQHRRHPHVRHHRTVAYC